MSLKSSIEWKWFNTDVMFNLNITRKPLTGLTWENRTCTCRDSWQHQTQTAEPWGWLRSHQRDWLAVQWTESLNKRRQQTKAWLLISYMKNTSFVHDKTHTHHALDSRWEMGLLTSRRNTWRWTTPYRQRGAFVSALQRQIKSIYSGMCIIPFHLQ